MSISDENRTSRHSSLKRARSISLSLKGFFKSGGSNVSLVNHTKNIYTNHNVKNPDYSNSNSNNTDDERRNIKSRTTSPVLAPIKTTDNSGRRKSLNESKLSKISQAKAIELQNSRNNNSNIHTPLPQSSMTKLPNSLVNAHGNIVSPVPIDNEISPSQTPKLSKANVIQSGRHNFNTGNPNISTVSSPLSPIHLPNIEKLSLSQIPSHLFYSHDTILSEEDTDDIITDTNSNELKSDNSSSIDLVPVASSQQARFSIDGLLDNVDKTGKPERSRSLKKINSTSSSIISSSNGANQTTNDSKLFRGRAHAGTISASGLSRYHRSTSPQSSNHQPLPSPDITCILQTENFKVYSNGTHEHNLKTISLVNGSCENSGGSGNKVKGMFSFSGFFKVGASNKNLDSKLELSDVTESNDGLNLEDAISLIPYHKKNLYARINTSSSSLEDEEDMNSLESLEKNKRDSNSGIPDVINPKAAVSCEELKLINTLSEKIHAGLNRAYRSSNDGNNGRDKIKHKKSDSSLQAREASPNSTKSNSDVTKIPFVKEYGKIIGTIGHGSYGVVSVCCRPVKDSDLHPLPTFSKDEKLYFAIKHLKPRPSESIEKFSTKITSEFIIGHSLSRPHKRGDKISPNISKVIDLLEINEKFVEVMEFCPSGDLYSLLTRKYKNGTALHPLEADCFMKQLLHGIKYMHDRGIAHCDLKPENILFHPNGLLKIADFGTSCVFQTAWEKHVHYQKGAMGSEPYVAPEEFISGRDYDPRLADCWSIGIVYCTMVLGRYLWKIAVPERDSFYESFMEEMAQDNEFYVFEELRHINHDINRMRRVVLYKIFQWNPERRISVNQILQSSWMKRTRCCIPYKV